MDLFLSAPPVSLSGRIALPASKSISNRLLIIRALTGNSFSVSHLSDSDDTRSLIEALGSEADTIDVGHAGTTMRFLAAFFAAVGRDVVLTGSERMKQRPIGPLVDALNGLGARITYLEKEGFPPIRMGRSSLSGTRVVVTAAVSSQFISALLLSAPALPQGLEIVREGKEVSSSYIEMTLRLMAQFGVEAQVRGASVYVPRSHYRGADCVVESDWSGASYWYALAALLPVNDLFLEGLQKESVQGDARVAEWFGLLGVESLYEPEGVRLRKTERCCTLFEMDLLNQPDLIQTFVVTLCMMEIPFRISGAETLRIKETDRIAALQREMTKLGYSIENPLPGLLVWDGVRTQPVNQPAIETYHDHRMAMAFAPAAVRFRGLIIRDAGVVSKSYPLFWDHLRAVGFDLG